MKSNIITKFFCKSKHWPPRLKKLEKIKSKLMNQRDLNFNKNNKYFLNLILTNDKEVKKLNFKYKSQIKNTDVLTFVNKLNNLCYEKDIYCDIFFSAETIKRDANKNFIDFYDHFTHLLVHSFLHINGYKHKKIKDFKRMKNLEIKILKNLDISNPYIINERH